MPLFDDPFFLVFHPGDMIDPPPQVSPAAIDDSHLLLLEDGHCLKDQALAVCGRPELRADAGNRGTSLVTLVQMVAGRLGQTLVPELAHRCRDHRRHRADRAAADRRCVRAPLRWHGAAAARAPPNSACWAKRLSQRDSWCCGGQRAARRYGAANAIGDQRA